MGDQSYSYMHTPAHKNTHSSPPPSQRDYEWLCVTCLLTAAAAAQPASQVITVGERRGGEAAGERELKDKQMSRMEKQISKTDGWWKKMKKGVERAVHIKQGERDEKEKEGRWNTGRIVKSEQN